MIKKLKWEVENLVSKELSTVHPSITATESEYIAFNCAITACHAVDWAWQAIQQKLKTEKPKYKDFEDFKRKIFNQCKSLKICRSICNTSKHANPRPPFIKCKGTYIVTNNDPENREYKFSLIVESGGTERNAVDIFTEAGRFLVKKFLQLDLFEDIYEEDNYFN